MRRLTRSHRLFLALLVFLGPAFATEKPNILLIDSDDQGYHDLGAVNDEILTPN